MIAGRIKGGDNGAFFCPLAHQACAPPAAQGQAQGIKQNGLAGPRLAGQHAQAGPQIQIQTIDQDNIGNG